ncbi:MAG: 30S ribosomal protein S12 methylthiotransferase RimO [Phycisphaeraceae bacterium]|nr:30S ribosomal protein S12 methylthiotransferase RimO [Phycisphaeraceae bacterium]
MSATKSKKKQAINTVAFVSLGCPKNLVDSEKMLGLLAEDGLMPISDEMTADAVVINTCGFLEASKEESVDEIKKATQLKKAGKIKRVIVAGCLVQRHRAKMLQWCPDIDAMIGVFDRDRIVEAVRGSRPTQNDIAVDLPIYSSIAANATVAKEHRGIEAKGYFESDATRLRLTPRHYAYLRISEGCNQNCTFCTIPSIRGKMRSKLLDAILDEARELMADGAFELNLIGQDTTSYGTDIGYDAGLSGMLSELDQLASEQGGAWLRLMYAYPSCFTDEMIDTMARLQNILPYIDIPLQHINDTVLDNMRRKTSRKLIETLLDKLRDRVPGMTIRTTFISGYPGETDAQHDELVAFVKDFGFENMGVFGYSPEPGTPAGTQHKQHAIPQDVIDARIEELMLAQQEVVFERNEALAQDQQEYDILIEEETETQGSPQDADTPAHLYEGRSYQQAPQVDSTTYVQANRKLAPGELVHCRIIGHSDYDLVARPVEELDKTFSLPLA